MLVIMSSLTESGTRMTLFLEDQFSFLNDNEDDSSTEDQNNIENSTLHEDQKCISAQAKDDIISDECTETHNSRDLSEVPSEESGIDNVVSPGDSYNDNLQYNEQKKCDETCDVDSSKESSDKFVEIDGEDSARIKQVDVLKSYDKGPDDYYERSNLTASAFISRSFEFLDTIDSDSYSDGDSANESDIHTASLDSCPVTPDSTLNLRIEKQKTLSDKEGTEKTEIICDEISEEPIDSVFNDGLAYDSNIVSTNTEKTENQLEKTIAGNQPNKDNTHEIQPDDKGQVVTPVTSDLEHPRSSLSKRKTLVQSFYFGIDEPNVSLPPVAPKQDFANDEESKLGVELGSIGAAEDSVLSATSNTEEDNITTNTCTETPPGPSPRKLQFYFCLDNVESCTGQTDTDNSNTYRTNPIVLTDTKSNVITHESMPSETIDTKCSEDQLSPLANERTSHGSSDHSRSQSQGGGCNSSSSSFSTSGFSRVKRLSSSPAPVSNNSSLQVPSRGHMRSESTSTTVSEREFSAQRQHVRTIERQHSQTTYKRMTQKFYDIENVICLEKHSKDEIFGFHLLGGSPVYVITVTSGSLAEKHGLRVGDMLITVNGVDVMASSVEEVAKLIGKTPEKVVLGVSRSSAPTSPITADETPLKSGFLYKLSSSGIRKVWKKRWVELKQDYCLYHYKTDKDKSPLGVISLGNFVVTRVCDMDREHAFKLSKFDQKTYYFAAKCDEEMSSWANALTKAADSRAKTSFTLASGHNIEIPALAIKDPECSGHMTKQGYAHKTWKKRYFVLKDASLYYYKDVNASIAKGVAQLHGYTVRESSHRGKPGFALVPPEPGLRTYYMAVENDLEKQRWLGALGQSIGRWQPASE